MKMPFVKLNSRSVRMIRHLNARYNNVETSPVSFPTTAGGDRVIVMMKPVADTIRLDNGNSEGFDDALFLQVETFEPHTRNKFPVIGATDQDRVDEVYFDGPCRMRFFKDGRVMVEVNGKCRVIPGKSVTISTREARDEQPERR